MIVVSVMVVTEIKAVMVFVLVETFLTNVVFVVDQVRDNVDVT